MEVKKTQFILALILLLSAHSSAEKVTFKCNTDSTCNSGHSYTFSTDDGKSSTQCTNTQTCSFDSLDLEVFRCDYSYTGIACNSKTCFLPYDRILCINSNTPTCPHQETVEIKCSTCNSKTCSSNKCLSSSNEEVCYNKDPCDYSSVNASYLGCKNLKDFTGKDCTCCAKFDFTEEVGECVDTYDFDSTAFMSFSASFRNSGISLNQAWIKLTGLFLLLIIMGWGA